jgi:dethiobiotin synthetase
MASHQSPVTSHGFFVTGTDTGVGKTLVACALLRAYSARGLRAIGMKPVAAGARLEAGRLVNDDVTALTAAGNVSAAVDLVSPYCFTPAIAPHIAAARAGVTIELGRVSRAYRALAGLADRVVVEGAGGFRVPLSSDRDMADLAVELALPVVMVVGMRLGCLNHALLTADAVRAAGLPLHAWVANHVIPGMAYADENLAALDERLGAPLLARIAYHANADAALIACDLKGDLLQ